MNLYCANPVIDTEVLRLLGSVVAELLRDPKVQEVSANYDTKAHTGRVFVDYGEDSMCATGTDIASDAIEAVTRMLATVSGKSLDPDAPFLNCVLASGSRYHVALSPVSDGARFSIRTHARVLRPLSDFLSPEEIEQVRGFILAHKNILIGGGTSSGKTTLANAMINEMPGHERLMVLEDEPELQVREGNVMRGRATASATLKRHVFETLRDRPDRIIVGEVRGPEAYDVLDAWSTGHSGGLATIHANDAASVLTRLARLANCDQQLIGEAIDIVLYVQRMPDGSRAVTQIKEVRQ
jgi:type IV secretion system protein VirB11